MKCNLRRLRNERSLTLRDVGELCGVSHNAIWKIEQGAEPLLSTALRLCAVLGCVISDVWPEVMVVKMRDAKGGAT